jgi:autotransporter-associated beta strand protein
MSTRCGDWLGANCWWDAIAVDQPGLGEAASTRCSAARDGRLTPRTVTNSAPLSVGYADLRHGSGRGLRGGGTTGQTLTVGSRITVNSGSAAVTIKSPVEISGPQQWQNYSANTLLLDNTISGTGPITKEGTGTLTLRGTNTYTGGVIINGGTLNLAADSNLGDCGWRPHVCRHRDAGLRCRDATYSR